MHGWLPPVAALIATLTAVLIAIVGVVSLRAFYRAFESLWPENYFGGATGVDPVVSKTPLRYVAFRSLPVLVVAYSCGVAAERLDAPRSLALVMVWVGYSAVSSVPAIWNALVGLDTPKLGLATYRVAGMITTTLAVLLAWLLGDRFDSYVPEGTEVAFAFWIAAATIATGHWSRSLMARHEDPKSLLDRARREVDESLLLPLLDAGHPYPSMLYALAYAEHLNRPRWVRAMERILLRNGGTYGLMQMRSPRPLTDAESVSLFLERLPSYPHISEGDYWGEDVRAFFLFHNDDAQLADLAQTLHSMLRSEFDEGLMHGVSNLPRDLRFWLGGAAVAGGVVLLLRNFAGRNSNS